mmetsp:Transcript_1841/g.5390  ORF Transcript_1841/g.5390 Transcript_1841/m.5390 type:complete len:202 (+) Transcript_1841:99-704(+)
MHAAQRWCASPCTLIRVAPQRRALRCTPSLSTRGPPALKLGLPTTDGGESAPQSEAAGAAVKERRHCRLCGGEGHLPCSLCGGTGEAPLGGWHSRNSIDLSRIEGSKWTARERTLGRTHFSVIRKEKQGKETYVLMSAACDETIQLWLNAKNLKSRELWSAGWLQRTQRLALVERAPCKHCSGEGTLRCHLCSNAGRIVEV